MMLFAFYSISTVSCTKTGNVKTTVYDTTTQILKDTVWENTTKNPIVGLWVGTFKIDGDATDSFYYSFDIDSNYRVITTAIAAAGNSSSSDGPWQLNGTTFTCTLTQLGLPSDVQAVTAVYDSVAGTLSGQNNYIQGSGLNTTFLLLRVQ